jgi:hypothetical protein
MIIKQEKTRQEISPTVKEEKYSACESSEKMEN